MSNYTSATRSAARVASAAVLSLAAASLVAGCVGGDDVGPGTYAVVARGDGTRKFPRPSPTTSSVGPIPEEIPLTIADDDRASELAVLGPGEEAMAENPNGWVRVRYLADDRRLVEWRDNLNDGDGTVYRQELKLRPRGVWYAVAGRYTRDPFPAGDVRVLYAEGQIRARSFDDALGIMKRMPGMRYVGGPGGLVVGYWPTMSREDVQLRLVRVYVDDVPSERTREIGEGRVEVRGGGGGR